MPVLETIGLLNNGKLTQTAKDKFVAQVLALLVVGNEDGNGLRNILAFPLPLPPSDINIGGEPVFYFKPQPLIAAATAPILSDKSKSSIYHSIFLDGLYEQLCIALNVNGAFPIAPICDPTAILAKLGVKGNVAFPPKIPDFLGVPDIAAKFSGPDGLPKLTAKLMGIFAEAPVPKIPKIPNIQLPSLPSGGSFILPQFTLALAKLPIDLIVKLVAPPNMSFILKAPNFLSMFGVILGLAFEALGPVLNLFTLAPPLLAATLIVLIKQVCAICLCDIIALLLGEGEMVKLAAQLLLVV